MCPFLVMWEKPLLNSVAENSGSTWNGGNVQMCPHFLKNFRNSSNETSKKAEKYKLFFFCTTQLQRRIVSNYNNCNFAS